MKDIEPILEILKSQFDWNLTNSITITGRKLVSDTLKAREIYNNSGKQIEKENFFQKLPLWTRYFYYMVGGIIIGYLMSKL